MPRDKRLVLFVLVIVICLSLWQMTDLQQFSPVPAFYSLKMANSTPYSYPIQNLPKEDYSQLIDLKNFKFEIVSSTCNDTSPLLLVLIHTSPTNYAKRKTIRETWGQKRDNLKIVFMLGKVENKTIMRTLEEENRVHRDFAQGNFNDSYRNMTYKHVMVFKYAIYHCPQAKYILKTDDDIFVNMPTLLDFLTQDLSPFGARNLLLCTPFPNSKVLRSYRSKWRVGFSEYPNKYYPPYCPGWALIYSPDVLFALYVEAQRSAYFWIDDVHITGTFAKRLKIEHTDVGAFTLSRHILDEIVSGSRTIVKPFIYGRPDLTEKQIRKLWSFVGKHNRTRRKTTPHPETY